MSPHFERLCQRRLPELLPRKYRKVGRWWYRDKEVDVVGITEEGKILGECKFTNSEMDKGHLARLESKEDSVRIEGTTEFALFSKGGFDQALLQESQERGELHLFEIEDIVP